MRKLPRDLSGAGTSISEDASFFGENQSLPFWSLIGAMKRYPRPATVRTKRGSSGSSRSASRTFRIAVLMPFSVCKKASLPNNFSMISARVTSSPGGDARNKSKISWESVRALPGFPCKEVDKKPGVARNPLTRAQWSTFTIPLTVVRHFRLNRPIAGQHRNATLR